MFSKNLYIPAPPPNCMYGPVGQAPPNKNIASEDDVVSRNLITIYPNPATDKLEINSPMFSNSEWVSIYDATGKLIHKEKVNSTKQVLNISTFRAGLYLIKVEIDGQIKKEEKIMKR